MSLRKILEFLLPDRAFSAIREGTKLWLIECRCGHKQDFWEAGGIRYKAVGEPRQLYKYPKCRNITLHKVRRKTEMEKHHFSELEARQSQGTK